MNTTDIQLSIIVAVYERQDELTELLSSLTKQTNSNFEMIIVDDGSKNKLDTVCAKFQDQLDIKYYYKSNSGPGKSRNYGMEKANGNYFIFLDSDTIIPSTYIQSVYDELSSNYVDAFGGPDDADESFNEMQKAITFSMTSFLTTGGIRGGKKQVGKFQPRSFNMGISRKAYEKTGGFAAMRIGEDPDLSMRLWENGFETRLFQDSKVIHKRRTSLKKFAKQVYQFGVARPILNQRHPNYVKPTFWFPSLFFLGTLFAWFTFVLGFIIFDLIKILHIPMMFWLLYMVLIFVFATMRFKSIKVGVLSMQTTLIQFFNYGYGFLESQFKLNILKQDPKKAFPSHFHVED
ncbi:glycosyltransferase [Faecalibacter macacae]|uniref:Glycosyltransferase n=1 Tax=Faecalibacter macacae TaxID=1859289 RepID=A0A3L9MEL4_9FLAO|nr:glycosyltransferase [Faecalibacter macacae]RLZ11540.1 glycosyltransferase [Faecalibacter macacae]